MHVKFAERIASNLAAAKRAGGEKGATKWWQDRFNHITKMDYDQVLEAVRRRAGIPKR